MFYAFLFKLLKDAPASNVFSAEIDYIIISLFGVPGSLMAMYAVDQVSLGRKGTMVLSTFITAVSLLSFALTTTPILKLASNCLNAFASNVMYGVIYSYTPEVFPTKVRGTASGIASCLARVTGAVSPSLTGFLLGISATLPLFVSVALFLLDGVLMILLPIETHGQAAL